MYMRGRWRIKDDFLYVFYLIFTLRVAHVGLTILFLDNIFFFKITFFITYLYTFFFNPRYNTNPLAVFERI